MSKKIQMLLVAGLFCVSLAGCDKKVNDENINQDLSNGSNANETESVIKKSKLANLVEKGAKMKCEYQMKEGDGEVNVTTYIDGEKFRAETNVGEAETVSVFDGDTYYSWTKGNVNQGTKMTKSCMEETQNSMQGSEVGQEENQLNSVDDIVKQESEMKMNCQEIDEIDFEIPTDVNFVDTCKMMEDIQNQPQNMDMEELQKQMEQMQKGL